MSLCACLDSEVDTRDHMRPEGIGRPACGAIVAPNIRQPETLQQFLVFQFDASKAPRLLGD